MTFSIIVVCLNPGDGLKTTVDSVLAQTYGQYEIIIKDGGSTDGSVEGFINHPDLRIKYHTGKDSGIYDAMNRAVKLASGDYIIFLNSGDTFYDTKVLERVSAADLPKDNTIAYGDTLFKLYNSVSKAPAKIDPSVCYRNIPCHQAVFYSRDTLTERGFDTQYRIRGDYEHFLNAFFEKKRNFRYLGFTVCSYEGGGFSEKKSNVKRDKDERRQIVRQYFSLSQRIKYDLFLALTLHKLRGALARNEKTAGAYQKLKSAVYALKHGNKG